MQKIKELKANEIEAANRAEATALLIRDGYRVYRPEADCYGEDLILRTPSGELRAVQLKSRMTRSGLGRFGLGSPCGSFICFHLKPGASKWELRGIESQIVPRNSIQGNCF